MMCRFFVHLGIFLSTWHATEALLMPGANIAATTTTARLVPSPPVYNTVNPVTRRPATTAVAVVAGGGTASTARRIMMIRRMPLFAAGPNSSVDDGPAPDDDDDDDKAEEDEWSDFADLGYDPAAAVPAKAPVLSSMSTNALGSEDVVAPENNDDDDRWNAELRQESQRQRRRETSSTSTNNRGDGGFFVDYTAVRSRQFSLGKDLILTNYVGDMGFDEVTDWQYYYQDVDEDGRPAKASSSARPGVEPGRKVVQPNPFDSTKPRRTRVSRGSVVRIFRGEFVGALGGAMSAEGLDRRVLVKEFSGTLALALAQAELESIGRLQSTLLLQPASGPKKSVQKNDIDAAEEEWFRAASRRSSSAREDNTNLVLLQKKLARDASFLGSFGEVNLAEVEFEPNEFYQTLSVAPPPADAVWLVYEYAGLSTVQAYCVPAGTRRARLPPQRGFFGNPIPPPALPPFRERAAFVVRGIIRQALAAVIALHDNGLVHRSIGRTTFILTTPAMDKRDSISVFNTRIPTLRVKLADLGFSGRLDKAANEEEFCVRARAFGLMNFRQGVNNVETMNFAIAEDAFAFGFVVLGLLLTSLAEVAAGNPNQNIPPTDEDTLQRLIGEIFDKDFAEFREYVDAEDAWSSLVALLDENDRAGWKFLEELLLCREKVAKLSKDGVAMATSYLRNLLASPFLTSS